MQLNTAGLSVNGGVNIASDRNLKENIQSISAKDILATVIALPMNVWNYKQDSGKVKHIGPMAQDFKRLFNVGQDDKTISTTDASGVAIAAIQGLNQKLTGEVKTLRARLTSKDEEALRLKANAAALAAQSSALAARLAAIEKKLGL